MKFNIGITGTGSLIGQAIIKSIIMSESNSDYNWIGVDYFNETVGSLFCKKNYILPDIYKSKSLSNDWISEIIKIIKKEKLSILFSGVDFELLLLSQNKQYIESKTDCTVIVSNPEVIKTCNDKYKTYQFLKNNKLSFPKTYLPDNVDYSIIKYPVIVKPRIGARSRDVFLVNSIDDLKKKIMAVNNPIIQENIGDIYSEYTCAVIFIDNKVYNSIVLKRTLKDGNTFISEHSLNFDPKIKDYVNAIAKKLKPYGSCNFQLRVDNDGIPKLFEINPRHSGTTYIRSLFGYNEIIFLIKKILEKKSIKFDLVEGKAIRYFEEKLILL